MLIEYALLIFVFSFVTQYIAVFMAISCELISFSIIIRVILSWVPSDASVIYNIRAFFNSITEPVLSPLRKIIPPLGGVMDLSPLIAVLLLEVIHDFLVGFIH